MPPLPAAPNTLLITLDAFIGTDARSKLKLHYKYTGGAPSSADCASIAAGVVGAWNADVKSLTDTDSGITGVQVADLNSTSGNSGTNLSTITGTRVGGGALPAETTAVIEYAIGRRYRGGKPKSFPRLGVSNDQLTLTTWTPTAIAAFQTGWGNFLGAITGLAAGATVVAGHVSLSYYNGFTPNPSSSPWAPKNVPKLRVAPVIDPILSFSCSAKLGTQRRRMQQ